VKFGECGPCYWQKREVDPGFYFVLSELTFYAKPPELEADHSPPSNAEVKRESVTFVIRVYPLRGNVRFLLKLNSMV
jgi:hypothetical protein